MRPRIQTATTSVLIRRQPSDELHGEERPAVCAQARFMDLGDPGMLEPGQDLSFVSETLDELGGNKLGAHHLERDRPARVILLGLVHRAHAPFGVPAENAIAADVRGDRARASPAA